PGPPSPQPRAPAPARKRNPKPESVDWGRWLVRAPAARERACFGRGVAAGVPSFSTVVPGRRGRAVRSGGGGCCGGVGAGGEDAVPQGFPGLFPGPVTG